MVPRWRVFGDFLGPAFPASCVQHVSDLDYKFTLEMWANANVMAALPNIGGALCPMSQSLADAHY